MVVNFVTNSHTDPAHVTLIEQTLRRHTHQVARLGLQRVYFAGVLRVADEEAAAVAAIRAALPALDLRITFVRA